MTASNDKLLAVLERIENVLISIEAKTERFAKFVLEVSPDEAEAEISELEKEL
jgi:hypothetical protein